MFPKVFSFAGPLVIAAATVLLTVEPAQAAPPGSYHYGGYYGRYHGAHYGGYHNYYRPYYGGYLSNLYSPYYGGYRNYSPYYGYRYGYGLYPNYRYYPNYLWR